MLVYTTLPLYRLIFCQHLQSILHSLYEYTQHFTGTIQNIHTHQQLIHKYSRIWSEHHDFLKGNLSRKKNVTQSHKNDVISTANDLF